MFKTVPELVQSVVLELSQVPGTSVQKYSEPRIRQKLAMNFDRLFSRYWWSQFLSIDSFELDGETGVVTEDVSSLIKRFVDIRYVWPSKSNTPLARLGARVNPLTYKGENAQCYMPVNDSRKVFKVLPAASQDVIVVSYRTLPNDFTNTEDLVNLDSTLLTYAVVYDFLESTGTNPNDTQKYQGYVEGRLNELIKEEEAQDIQRYPGRSKREHTDWWTPPLR